MQSSRLAAALGERHIHFNSREFCAIKLFHGDLPSWRSITKIKMGYTSRCSKTSPIFCNFLENPGKVLFENPLQEQKVETVKLFEQSYFCGAYFVQQFLLFEFSKRLVL